MNSFIEEIANLTGLPFDVFSGGFRVINLGNHAVYVEGGSLVSLTQEEIKIKLKRGLTIISGQNLRIKDMGQDSALIVGKIEKLEVC